MEDSRGLAVWKVGVDSVGCVLWWCVLYPVIHGRQRMMEPVWVCDGMSHERSAGGAGAAVYFVQGILGLARLGVTYLFKDDFRLDPAEASQKPRRGRLTCKWECSSDRLRC